MSGHDLMNPLAVARCATRLTTPQLVPLSVRIPVIMTMSLLTTMSHQATQNGWSAAVDELLGEVVHDGFTFYLCGHRLTPAALVACYHWDSYVDLLTITGPNQVVAARAINDQTFDVFHPGAVVWAYGTDAEPTIRALLTLTHPDHPDHPTRPFAPPRLMTVPAARQRPLTVKAPEPWKAGNRTRRLEATLTSEVTEMARVGLVEHGTGLGVLSVSSTQPNPGPAA